MYLNEIRIYGFKSFPDPLHLKLNRGIIGFVGPNGSGKSNIVDAVRWTLGEQSPRELRAASMENIIFNGTYKRKSSNLANVALKFVNEGELPLDFSEVEFERKLYRTGESQYLINKESVRLKDIQNMLADTGLGVKSYSLFKRSLIEEIVHNKPDALKNLFEESAGISTYRQAKKETLRKLIHAQENLQRINDLIVEIEKQHRDLKRQANKAKRYNEYKNIVENLNEYIIRNKIQNFTTKIEELNKVLKIKEEKLAILQNEIIILKENLYGEREKRRELEHKLNGKTKEKEDLQEEIYNIKSNINLMNEKMNSLNNEINFINNNKEKQLKEQPIRKERLNQYKIRLKELKNSMKELNSEANAEEDEGIVVLYKKTEEDFNNTEDLLRQKKNKTMIIESQTNMLNVKIESIEKTVTEKEKEKIERKNALENAKKELEKISKQINEYNENKNKVLLNEKEINDKITDINKSLSELEEKKSQFNNEILSLKSHINHINQRIKETQSSFEKIKDSINDEIILLRNLVNTKENYEDYVKHALSYFINTIIIKKEKLSSIIENKISLLSFIVEDVDIKRKNHEKGLDKFVNAPEYIKNFLSYFVICNEEEILNTDNEYFYITKNGLLKMPSGLIVKTGEIKTLNFEKSLKESEEKIKNNQNELMLLEEKIKAKKQYIDELGKERDGIIKQISEIDSAYKYERETLKAIEMRIESSNRYIQKLNNIINENIEEKEKIELLRENIIKEKEQLNNEVEELKEQIAEKEKLYHETKEKFIIYNNRKNKLHEIITKTEEEIKLYENEIYQLEKNIGEYEEEIAGSEDKINSNKEKINEYRKTISVEEEKENKLREKLLNMEEGILKLEKELNDIDIKIDELTDGEEEKDNIIDELKEEIQKSKIDKEKYITEMNINKENEDEDFEIDEELIKKYKDTAEEQLDFLREKMLKMEPINQLAFQEYTEVTERLDEINKQKIDVINAKENLEKTIKTLDAKAKTIFLQYFDTIRTNFKELFYDIFKTGNADIILADEKNPLETDIQIIFEPREKKINNLVELSDGEKALMIIALLFAMYMVRPTPVSIMDEVDGPLDDANVENFAKLLKKFRNRTQFIIITHNKRTMEFCDYLFGVTMEESGVTSVVSLNLQSISDKFLNNDTK